MIHRDIKPDNFVMGKGDNSNILYLIDFGLTKKYKINKNNVPNGTKENKIIVGTARYSSINALRGLGKLTVIKSKAERTISKQ